MRIGRRDYTWPLVALGLAAFWFGVGWLIIEAGGL